MSARLLSSLNAIIKFITFRLTISFSDAVLVCSASSPTRSILNHLQVCRCWVVFVSSKRRLAVIAVPTLLWLASTACGIVTIVHLMARHQLDSLPKLSSSRPYLLVYLGLTLVQNIVTTGALPLWSTHMRVGLIHV